MRTNPAWRLGLIDNGQHNQTRFGCHLTCRVHATLASGERAGDGSREARDEPGQGHPHSPQEGASADRSQPCGLCIPNPPNAPRESPARARAQDPLWPPGPPGKQFTRLLKAGRHATQSKIRVALKGPAVLPRYHHECSPKKGCIQNQMLLGFWDSLRANNVIRVDLNGPAFR